MFTYQDMSTRELKNALDATRVRGNYEEQIYIGTRIVKGNNPCGVYATEEQIRAELAKRPHIPSAAEGKLLRRLIAETGQSADWLRAHPKYGMMLVDVQHPNRKEVPKSSAPFMKKVYGKLFGRMCKVVEDR